MIIEVQGTNFNNKGAELMLLSILQRASNWNSSVRLTADLKTGRLFQRKDLGIAYLASIDSQKLGFTNPLMWRFLNATPSLLRHRKGIYLPSELNGILDAFGLAYSNQSPKVNMRIRWNLSKAKKLKRNGGKLILMPQAFGPFWKAETIDLMLDFFQYVDFAYPRENESYRHLAEIGVDRSKLRVSPDFTSPLRGVKPSYSEKFKGWVCIIPNYRMVDRTTLAVGNQYLGNLKSILKICFDLDLNPFILVHTQKDENGLITSLLGDFNTEIPVVREDNPLFIKGLLNECRIVISSRFHGLVSALSQNVPCLASGWHHKYSALFEEYDCSDYVFSSTDSIQALRTKIQNLAFDPQRSLIVENLKKVNRANHKKIALMWAEIEGILF